MNRNKFLITVFILILALPSLDTVFNFAPVKELFEKRLPTEFPTLPKTIDEVKAFPQKFEAFFNDNYGFRKTLVSINSEIMDDIFNESPDARAIIGKDDWLFFDNHDSLLDAVGKATISDELINKAVKSFAKNWQKMRQNNIDYLVIIAADKSSIYPEFLPSYMTPKGPHRIDKFLTALKAQYPDFPIIDLRPLMLKAKEKEIIYHKTDTHWNKRGAHYGYLAAMNHFAQKNKNIRPNLRYKFEDKAEEMLHGDIAQIMNSKTKNLNYDLEPKFDKSYFFATQLPKAITKKYHKPLMFENNNQKLPRLFAYKDSFFSNIEVFIAEHFSYGFLVNEFPCDLDYEIIKQHNPNVVIQQFWEGRINSVFTQCKN